MNLKLQFFSIFSHKSLEFRAKIFSAMLLAKKHVTKDDFEEIYEIGMQIYPNNPRRVKILINLIKEYINKSNVYKKLNLDSLLKDIDFKLKNHKNYVKKIDFSHLRRLISDENEDDALIQQRVYEYLVDEVKRYS